MSFSLDIWKEKAGAQLRQAGDWLAHRATQDTPYLVYGTLCGLSLWPLVEAAQGGALLPAVMALGNVAAGVGGNLLAEQIQSWKEGADQAQVSAWVREHAPTNADLREALDDVLVKLEAVPQAQTGLDAADRERFTATLRRELVQLGNLARFEATLIGDGAIAQDHSVAAGAGGVAVGGDVGGDAVATFHRIETEGGTYVEGNVQAGTFVGRDMHVHGDMYNGPPPEDTKEALTIYRRVVAQACGQLPLRGVDVGAADATAGKKPMGLAHVYVDLDTTTSIAPEGAAQGDAEGERHERGGALSGERETRPLSALEAVVANRRLVLLGDPGGGKSTFVNYVAYSLALSALGGGEGASVAEESSLPGWPETERERLPIRVILRDFARWLPDPLPTRAEPCHLWDFIEARLKAQKLDFVAKPLCTALEQGRALLLLDGLDEVPTPAQRVFVRDAVRTFVDRYDDPNRVTRNRVLITCRVLSYQLPADPDAPDLRLSSFPTFELAPFDADKVDGFIDAWYAELARTGVVRAQDAGGLARELREAVRRPDLWRLASNPLLLTVMALVHTHTGRLPDARALLYEDTVDILLWRWEQLKAGGGGAAPRLQQLLLEAGRSEMDLKRVLAQLAYQAHTQVDDGTEDGEALADIGEFKLHKALAALKDGDLNWAGQVIETMKLRAGLLLERAPEVFTFPHRTFQEYLAGAHLATQPGFAQQACKLAEAGAVWREVILLAVGRLVYRLEDIAKLLALVGELCPAAAPQDATGWRKAWLAGDALLEAGINRVGDSALGWDLLMRVRARLADLVTEGRLSPRERVEAGDTLARLGDPRPGLGVDPETGRPDFVWCEVSAGPFLMGEGDRQHTVELSGYSISLYPVTNHQYRSFVEAGGYEERRYWTAEGLEWKEREGWNAPRDYGTPFNLENHPVVGVSWYEALAYCCWLTEVWREAGRIGPDEAVRLPTEAEWEKAARGTDGRRYPWGNDANPARANYDHTSIGSTSAVGCFPNGASPYGCLDMAGNVWEWTSSLYEAYPYNASDGREDLGARGRRVLRGGAFNNLRDSIRCVPRDDVDSSDRYFVVGMRVVVSSIPPALKHEGRER